MDRDRARARPRRSSRSAARSTLEHRYLVGERGATRCTCCPTFVADADGELRPNPEAARLDAARRRATPARRGPARARRLRTPEPGRDRRAARRRGRCCPAIAFVFSRGRLRPGGRAVPRRRAAAHRPRRARADPRASPTRRPRRSPTTTSTCSRYDEWLAGLEAGFAAHHAGMVPPMKEAVEEAFAAGLVKVVFATETLALGINMPARSVVIEKLSKFTGERHEFLTPGEYTQLTGRAGRRGIDERRLRDRVLEPVRALRPGRRRWRRAAPTRSRRRSARRTTWPRTSCAATPSSRRTTCSTCRSRSSTPTATSWRSNASSTQPSSCSSASATPAASDLGDVARVPARSRRELDAAAREPRRRRAGSPRRIEALRPGDVVVVRRRRRPGRRARATSTGRGGGRRVAGARPEPRASCGSGPTTSTRPPRRGGTHRAARAVRAPQPGVPPPGRGAAAPGELRDDGARRRRRRAHEPSSTTRSRDHPVARRPAARAAAARPRRRSSASSATSQRLERRVRGRSESLARQFDRVLRVLEAWGYVDGWALTDARASCSPACTPRPTCSSPRRSRDGLLDGLDRARARRGRLVLHLRAPRARGQRPMPPRALADEDGGAAGAGTIERHRGRTSAPTRTTPGSPRPVPPIPGSRRTLYDWAAGDALADVLDDDEMTGGDFVGNVKQCIDLLRQIGDVAPDPDDRATARARPPTPASAASSRRRASCRVSEPVIAKGEPWGEPAIGAARRGRAAATTPTLARPRSRDHPGAGCAFVPADPTSDLARAARASPADGRPGAPQLALRRARASTLDDRGAVAVNMVVARRRRPTALRWLAAGAAPCAVAGRRRGVVHDGPATTVVVANGQYLRGLDVVPRGHPGDGRLEVQVYALAPASGAAMRAPARRRATHLPAPRHHHERGGREVEVRSTAGASRSRSTASPRAGPRGCDVDVVPGAFLLRV